MRAPDGLVFTHDVVSGEQLMSIFGVDGEDDNIEDLETSPGVIQVCDGAWVRESDDRSNWRFWIHPDADPMNV
jgi:hypothetical protein